MNAADYTGRCHFGDVRDVLRQMIADGVRVNCIVTSPPYWGLRSYLQPDHPDKVRELGSEPKLREFIDTMAGVFMLAREVLADDGTCWINMGDCYATGAGKVNTAPGGGTQGERWAGARNGCEGKHAGYQGIGPMTQPNRMPQPGLKPKDLVGQPWRLAFALQDAGWWLRQDIIWSKPNPMPESTRDRCTKAHEYLFLLAKQERYYYDFDAVMEPVEGGSHARRAGPNSMRGQGSNWPEGGGRANRDGRDMATATQGYKSPDGWNTGPGAHGSFHVDGREKGKVRLAGNVNAPKGQMAYEAGDDKHRTKGGLLDYAQKTSKLAEAGSGTKNNDSMDEALADMRNMRNRRSVWTVASEPYKGAHFATFPTKLIEHCILAGCPPGGIVLDLFLGSGTTAQVAEQLGRKWIGIDLDQRNEALQRERLQQRSMELAA